MKISQIYTYPIKALRGVPLSQAQLSEQGLAYDRRFMLLKVHDEYDEQGKPQRRLENMHIAEFPDLALFLTDIQFPSSAKATDGKIVLRYKPPGSKPTSESIEVPLQPQLASLGQLEVTMHKSPTVAYNMSDKYNAWFSSCLGYEVILAYIGSNRRQALGTLSPNAATKKSQSGGSSWLSSFTDSIPFMRYPNTVNGEMTKQDDLTFTDCAQLLVVSETSLASVSARLPEDQEMDIRKFRPNIIVSGASAAFEEDFWGEIKFLRKSDCNGGMNEGGRRKESTEGSTVGVPDNTVTIHLTHNCARCKSINIDYETGKPGTGEAGKVLKLLMRDRRVDKGTKYSPIFGRYGFLKEGDAAKYIRVGDEVNVTRHNEERTVFDWPGLTN
ncbi:MAG: hypothetical protein M1819_001056 [Sarea resinae]|nr:MAG: hypothetical protein M1819_001056 [Sarea resinae]